ncbi:MAG: hypothetical protein ABL308_04255 [Oceanicaulis sp.]
MDASKLDPRAEFAPGLKPAETARLSAAGFPPRHVAAIAGEAATMRFLFLARQNASAILGGAVAIFGGLGTGALGAIFGDFGWALTTLLAMAGGVVAFAPQIEAEAMRRHHKVRWAGRRIAVLAVKAETPQEQAAAEDEAEDDEDDESFTSALQSIGAELSDGLGDGKSAFEKLQRWGAVAAGYPDPRGALLQIARELERPKKSGETGPLAPRRDGSGALLAERGWLYATLAVIFALAVAAMAAGMMLGEAG